MAKKFYAVLKGHKVGIFTTWAACQLSTKGYSGAAFKSFTTQKEADEYLAFAMVLRVWMLEEKVLMAAQSSGKMPAHVKSTALAVRFSCKNTRGTSLSIFILSR